MSNPGTSHGLFYRDARMLSWWELRLQPPHALSTLQGIGELYE